MNAKELITRLLEMPLDSEVKFVTETNAGYEINAVEVSRITSKIWLSNEARCL